MSFVNVFQYVSNKQVRLNKALVFLNNLEEDVLQDYNKPVY